MRHGVEARLAALEVLGTAFVTVAFESAKEAALEVLGSGSMAMKLTRIADFCVTLVSFDDSACTAYIHLSGLQNVKDI